MDNRNFFGDFCNRRGYFTEIKFCDCCEPCGNQRKF